MLFDRCRLICESRDPLLALHKPRAATSSPTMAPEAMDDIAIIFVPGLTWIEAGESESQNEGFTAKSADGKLSVTQRIIDAAGRVVRW